MNLQLPLETFLRKVTANRNIILVGNSNYGKTFLLKSLTKIHHCFTSPTSGTFNWVGAEKSECAILNDFRWSDKIIPWADLLNLLEGEPIQVSVPKTHYAENPYGTKDTPIFATSKSRIRKYERGQIDDVMRPKLWRVDGMFSFSVTNLQLILLLTYNLVPGVSSHLLNSLQRGNMFL